MTTPSPAFSLDIDGTSLDVVSVGARLRLSEIFRFEVEAVETSAPVGPDDRLGKPCVLTIELPIGPALVVHGLVVAIRSSAEPHLHETLHHHTIEIGPVVEQLTVGRDHRYFQDLDVVDIVKQVLSDAAVDTDVEWQLTGTYRKRVYTVQYGESDWEFIQRLFAEEGITFRFDFEESATKLVIVDDTTTAPDVGPLPFRSAGGRVGEEAIAKVSARTTIVNDRVVLRDYDPAHPTIDQTAEAEAASGPHEVYDYPGRYATPSDGKALAKRRLEALRARMRVLRGISSTLRIIPGHCFEIEEAQVPSFGGKLLVTALETKFARAVEGMDEGARIEIHWEGIPSTTPFRPAPRPTFLEMPGVQTAFVVGPSGNELHVDDNGRVRAQFHWDRTGKKDESSSTWMRVGQFALGNSMILPRIGWALLVEHHAGDADQPHVVGHLYDGTHPVPYPLPANKTRTAFQTATSPGDGSSNEVRFEDKKGSEEIFLNASKDMNVIVGDNKAKKVGNNHDHQIGSNLDVKVGANRALGVTADQSVTISGSETLTVSANRSTTVKGSETITVGGSRSVTTIMGKSTDADGGRTMTVGGNMFALAALGVARSVLGSASVTVAGSWVSAAASGLSNVTVGAAAETVGGVKLQVGVGGVTLAVTGALAEAVGAAYVNAAGGNCGETATGALSIKVGGALMANAPKIIIEADSGISITCGGTSLVIGTSSIELKSPLVPAPGGSIAKKGGPVHHNA